MMTNNTKNSAQQKSKNLRKRSRTDVIVAAKVSRIENSKKDVIDPYLHSDTIPMFSSISHHSRCIIKRTLLEYIGLVRAQIVVGWIPTTNDVKLYCTQNTLLNPEVISLCLGDKLLISSTKKIRHYIRVSLENYAKMNVDRMDTGIQNDEINECLEMLDQVPLNILRKAVERDVSIGGIKYYCELNDQIQLTKLAPELCLIALKMGHFKLGAELIKAFAPEHFAVIRRLITKDNQFVLKDVQNMSTAMIKSDNLTLLHFAATYPNIKVIKSLLFKDAYNWTVLHYAAVCSSSKLLRSLLTQLPTTCIGIKNADLETILHCAARAGRVENVQLILRTAKEEECRLNTENMLLNRPLIRTVFGDGVLQNSSLFSDFKVVKNLLSTKNIDGKTALDLAVEYNRLEVVQILQQAAAAYDDDNDEKTKALFIIVLAVAAVTTVDDAADVIVDNDDDDGDDNDDDDDGDDDDDDGGDDDDDDDDDGDDGDGFLTLIIESFQSVF
ncbi:unnamed protein product [Enterobius vermicularis]|uniref:ANK_REP_REGION domain-containing protein n=1 Tax=Enterobius vermicularis TaxID=51028 RepID=A0A0N4UZ59_ENTVE|nr:unnamed protein product [Enterobius vermicularis]